MVVHVSVVEADPVAIEWIPTRMSDLMDTSARAGSHSAAPPHSEQPTIEIHLFHCGHGDTIVIRLPDGRWGLIDCYLPEQYGIRDRFFDFLDRRKVKTFDFIIQSHPDYDHYHGMQAVIEYFLGQEENRLLH